MNNYNNNNSTSFVTATNEIQNINDDDIEKPFILSNVVKKYINLENDKKRKIRELRDASTKCFTNIFFDSTKMLFRFVFWVYHKVNCELMKVQQKYCNRGEKIIFFFKGGNIMFLWRKKFEQAFGPVNADISKKTSISDNDFTIYIITNDERRYNEIYAKVKTKLMNVLEEIGDKFDLLYSGKTNINHPNVGNNNGRIDFHRLKNLPEYCEWFYRYENDLFHSYFKNFYKNRKFDKLKEDIKRELITLKNPVNSFFEEKNNKIYRYSIPDDFNIEIMPRKSLILRPEDAVPDSFSLRNFSDDKYHYVTVNANIFNNLSKAGHLIAFDLYRIKFNVIISNILRTNSINKYNNLGRLNERENFGIPSEFIDISVPKFFDLNLQKMRQNMQERGDIILIENFALVGARFGRDFVINPTILTMRTKYIVEDLLITLFAQNIHNPMIDAKYDKRLFRTFFFYIGSNIVNKLSVLPRNLFEKIDDNFYRTFLEEDLPIDIIKHMKGKKIIDFFNVRPEYNSLKYLIQFTILFNKLYDNNQLLQEYIIYYNDIYSIIDNNSVDDFKVKFNKYKEDLDKNYKKAYDYFFGPPGSQGPFSGGLRGGIPLNPRFLNKGVNGNIFKTFPYLKNKDNINKFLDIGDGVELIYKNIDIKMDKVKRNIYPSFDDDI